MSKSEDITRLDRAIKDATIRIRTVLTNVDAHTKEIDLLYNQEKALEENVKCLKKKRIIAVAKEFKKSKEELECIRSRITILSNDRTHFLQIAEDMKAFIDKTKQELDRLEGTNDNNVLQFNRSVKDG
jgi:predicted  nucleic acid-binding Zn-ribbon protein